MDLFSPGEPKFGFNKKQLRKAISKPLRQNLSQPSSGNSAVHPPQWSQSAVNLVAALPPANQSYHQYQATPPPYYPPIQPSPNNHPIIQYHNWASTTNLPNTTSLPVENNPITPLNQRDSAHAVIGDKLSEIISLIDEDLYSESDKEIVIAVPQTPPPSYTFPLDQNTENVRSLGFYQKPGKTPPQQPNRNVNVLTKLSYYSNSRLPASLPPFRVYISTYPLLCLAALCSANAYGYNQNAVKNEQLIQANARIGTKAMVIKSVTCSDERTLVFAIRGTSVLSLRDWNVNLNTTPESPAGFLDDEGNYCHSGFLRVAKAMVKPIAARLRHLLEENPNRMSYSLLITGHSAGGAVASLLYAHMLSEHVKSELTILTDCFKRVHCVTFGAPPISLLPLQKPPNKQHRLQKCLFHSFINEGDPVVRAEKAYIMSLVDLLTTTPASASSLLPNMSGNSKLSSKPQDLCTTSMSLLKITNLGVLTGQKKPKGRHHSLPLPPRPPRQGISGRIWDVPQGTLSNAGRLVVLRGPEPAPKASVSQVDLSKEFEEVRAYTVTDDEIRKVIFGDPLMHAMDVYRRRIEALAMKAVTGRDRYY